MSHFYGKLRGMRGEATRCGSKSSGIRAHLRSWNNDVYAELMADAQEKDVLKLQLPVGLRVVVGQVAYVFDGRFLVPEKKAVKKKREVMLDV